MEQPHRSDQSIYGHRSSFRCSFVSNSLFVLGSFLYLWLSIQDLHYEDRIEDIPDDVLIADDDAAWLPWWPDDDYIFAVRTDVWVSEYQILYFVAALCFVVVGVIDLLNKQGAITGGLMILAGLFGLVSAVLVERSLAASNLFDSISVHLFLLEAVQIMLSRLPETYSPLLKSIVFAGDCCFVIGALGDVVLSYFAVLDKFNTDLARIGIVAAAFWLVAAFVYLGKTFSMLSAHVAAERFSHEITKHHTFCTADSEMIEQAREVDIDKVDVGFSMEQFQDELISTLYV